jgi:hypothetical protein
MDGGSVISLEELEAQITELAGHLNAANYRWLTLIAEFDHRNGWADGKLASCAHWLNFKCGLNLGAAREKVRVAHALAGLPKIAASMSRGELSYSKARALTRVACAATEDTLLMIALHGTVLKGRLPAAAGAMLIKALDAALETLPQNEISAKFDEEWPIPHAARRADALAAVAESFLAQSDAPSNTAHRVQIVVHVDAETLRTHAAGRCEIEHGPAIPAETVRRLSCDASLISVLENEQGEPLDVGRKTRSIPPAIRRALNTRDAGCRFPGCTHQRYVDAHHIEHWADGGDTKLSNLVTLCRLHHRLVHEGEIIVENVPGGGWRFLHPDGRHYEVIRCSEHKDYDWEDLERTHTELGIHIDSKTAATRWRGERMDYDLGVWILCQQAERGRNPGGEIDSDGDDDGDQDDVSAETSEDEDATFEEA